MSFYSPQKILIVVVVVNYTVLNRGLQNSKPKFVVVCNKFLLFLLWLPAKTKIAVLIVKFNYYGINIVMYLIKVMIDTKVIL